MQETLLRLRTYPVLSHFQNDGATVDCSTSTSLDSANNSMLFELSGVEEKEWGKRYWWCLLKRMFVVGPHRSIVGACSGSD